MQIFQFIATVNVNMLMITFWMMLERGIMHNETVYQKLKEKQANDNSTTIFVN